MPDGRKALLAAIEQILAGGGVQRLIVRYGKPIVVVRAVKDDGSAPELPSELLDNDIMAAVRNVEMEEFLTEKEETPFEYLFRAFNILNGMTVDGTRLQPKIFIVKKLSYLYQWLGVQALASLFNVEIMQHIEMPEDGLLLVAANASDIEDVKFSLKMELDLQWRAK